MVAVALDFVDPCCGGGHLVEIEHASVQYLVQVEVAEVAFYDFSLGLEVPDYLLHASEVGFADFRDFVQNHDVAELYLLYQQVLYVVLFEIAQRQVFPAVEFALHAQGVDDGGDAVHFRYGAAVPVAEARNGADGLGYGGGFADSAGFNHDVVELSVSGEFVELLHEIHLQGAADASVLQGHETVVLLANDSAFLDQGGVHVDFAEVVDYHGELDSLSVGEYAVQQSGLSAAEITGQQQDRNILL